MQTTVIELQVGGILKIKPVEAKLLLDDRLIT